MRENLEKQGKLFWFNCFLIRNFHNKFRWNPADISPELVLILVTWFKSADSGVEHMEVQQRTIVRVKAKHSLRRFYVRFSSNFHAIFTLHETFSCRKEKLKRVKEKSHCLLWKIFFKSTKKNVVEKKSSENFILQFFQFFHFDFDIFHPVNSLQSFLTFLYPPEIK